MYKRFGRAVKTVPTATIREVFDLTEAGTVRLGVVPIENSVEGSINETYDMLVSYNLAVVGEVILRVVHCLIALDTARLEDIKVVYSHPQALAQCRNFVRSMGLEPRVTYDTAGSAKHQGGRANRGGRNSRREGGGDIWSQGLEKGNRGLLDELDEVPCHLEGEKGCLVTT